MISRDSAIEALSSGSFDVLVIGGGITGAGVALDAAARGMSVALIERGDWAQGTSSRSSKLVHGGLRYLQQFDLGLVREALLERSLMVRLAPHLVRPLPMVVPAFDGQRPDLLIGIGLNMYDVMSTPRRRDRRAARRVEDDGAWSPERHRTIPGEEVRELIPALAARNPTGGYLFYDCQTDDVRLVLTVLGEAERSGAILGSRLAASELLVEDGVAAGVLVRDERSGERFPVRAANVINATGVWADRLRPEELHDEAEMPKIAPSRGTHIVLDSARLPLRAGTIVPAGGGRSIFALPWLGSTLIGTTDNPYDGDIDHVQPSGDDVGYLLDAVNAFFAADLSRDDVLGAYAGVRPLISTGDSRKSVDISRRAELFETSSGMVTITGGKLTTWRRMAKLAVDRVVERSGLDAPCRTDTIPLGAPIRGTELPQVPGVGADSVELLAGRYGREAERVLRIAAERPELAGPVLPGHPDLLAEVVFAARHEQALTVADVLLRRTRLGLLRARELGGPDGTQAVEQVADVLGGELGWDASELAARVAEAAAEVRAEAALLAPAAA